MNRYRVTAGQQAAALLAAKLREDSVGVTALQCGFPTVADLAAGMVAVAEQLCIELAAERGCRPEEVAAALALECALSLAD